jgi:hypothetical protein
MPPHASEFLCNSKCVGVLINPFNYVIILKSCHVSNEGFLPACNKSFEGKGGNKRW